MTKLNSFNQNKHTGLYFLLYYYTIGFCLFFLSIAVPLFLWFEIDFNYCVILCFIIIAGTMYSYKNFGSLGRLLNNKCFQYVLFIYLFIYLFLSDLDFYNFGTHDKTKNVRVSFLANFYVMSIIAVIYNICNNLIFGFFISYAVGMFFTILQELMLTQTTSLVPCNKKVCVEMRFIVRSFLILVECLFLELISYDIKCKLINSVAEKELVTLGSIVYMYKKENENEKRT